MEIGDNFAPACLWGGICVISYCIFGGIGVGIVLVICGLVHIIRWR
jgi:hypothetical protein